MYYLLYSIFEIKEECADKLYKLNNKNRSLILYIKNQKETGGIIMERFKILTDSEILRIDQASRALLWEVGVEVTDSRARDYYAKAGAVVDNATNMVRIPDWLITETLNKCS